VSCQRFNVVKAIFLFACLMPQIHENDECIIRYFTHDTTLGEGWACGTFHYKKGPEQKAGRSGRLLFLFPISINLSEAILARFFSG